MVGRVVFALSDCFNSLPDDATLFDLIVSNPPYISAAALEGLQKEVRDHEPLLALSPGPDGLAVIRRLIEEAAGFLKREGYLILEIGYDQAEAIPEFLDPIVWKLVEIRPDLQRIPRIVVLQKISLE